MATIISYLLDYLLLMMSSIGIYMSFITAFKFKANLVILGLIVFIAFVYYLIFKKLDRKYRILCIIILIIPYIIFFSSLINGTKQIAMNVFLQYQIKDKHFNIPYLSYVANNLDIFIAYILIYIPIVICIAHYYASKKHLILHYLPAILLLWVALLYQLIPNYYYISMLIIPILVGYLSHYNPNSIELRGGLTLILSIICGILIFTYNPDQKYSKLISLDRLQYTINHAGKKINSEGTISESKDLSNVGPIAPTDSIRLYVEGDYLGSFKIKGMTYESYNNDTWAHMTSTSEDSLESITRRLLNLHQEHIPYSIKIYTSLRVRSTLYTPYFPTVASNGSYTFIAYKDIYHNNYDDIGDLYIREINNYISYHSNSCLTTPAYLDSVLNQYIKEIGITSEDSAYEAITKIRLYFESNFTYTYNAMVPQNNFVEDFLETKEGYCTHFATAATLLLRKAGYMARYVEGYQVSEYEDGRYIVREDDAHAWVEYFDNSVGWIPYEVTTAYNVDSTTASYQPVTYEPDKEDSGDEIANKEEDNTDPILTPEKEEQTTKPTDQKEEIQTKKSISKGWIIGGLFLFIIIGVRLYRTHLFYRYGKQSTNQYVLFLYHQLDTLHITPEKDIYELVLKAMYSNIMLSNEECKKVEDYYFKAIQQDTFTIKQVLIYYYFTIHGGKKYD